MDDADFAAFGRYKFAEEAIVKLTDEFNRLTQSLGEDLKRCYHNRHMAVDTKVPAFDAVKMRQQLEEIATVYENLIGHCREANLHAERLGKTPYKTPQGKLLR
jgi:hypothetical protein